MNTPTDLVEKLAHASDIVTAITIYKQAASIIKTYEGVKDKAKDFVRTYIERTGETTGRTPTGTFGMTKPTPTFRVNEEKWQAACATNSRLAAIQKQFDAAQRALDEAQREFLEDATPEPTIYIR